MMTNRDRDGDIVDDLRLVVPALRNRIEELEAKLDDKEAECRCLRGQVNTAEAKLAKAAARLEKLSYWLNLDDEELAACSLDELAGDYRKIQDEVNDILSELRGESDE